MIELEPLITYGIEILVAVLGLLGAMVLKKLSDITGIKRENEIWNVLDGEIDKVLDTVEVELKKRGGKVDISTESRVIEIAGNLLAEQAPKTLRRTGITPTALAKRLEGRLNGRMD